MRGPLVALLLAGVALVPAAADAMCRCHRTRAPRCAPAGEKHRVTMKIDLAVENDAVEVITQSGPYHVPVADLDGKLVLFILSDVLDHLDAKTALDPNHDPRVGQPLGLTPAEKLQLYGFLKTLRSPPVVVRGPTGKLCDDAAVAALRARLPE